MHYNLFWIFFLAFIAVLIMIYSIFAGIQIYRYLQLNEQISAKEIQWSVISQNSEKYVPFARYQFIVNGTSYQGQTLWQEYYLNEWTAKEAIKRLSSPSLVWYDSSNPDVSSLQKYFPLKDSIYAILLWLLGFYFLGLGYYVKHRLF